MQKVDTINKRERPLTARGTSTRNKVLSSTIECIACSGFAALTVENVIQDSGISRGSILHYFPTRIALAVAAADQAMELMLRDIDRQVKELKNPYDRLVRHAEVLWEAQNLSSGLALMEILQSSRWDAELSTALEPMIEVREAEVKDRLILMAADAGMEDPLQYVSRGWLLVATIRGLIIEYNFYQNRTIISAAIEDMKDAHRRYCERAIPAPKRNHSKV